MRQRVAPVVEAHAGESLLTLAVSGRQIEAANMRDDAETAGRTTDAWLRKMKKGMFGVLFVMAKDGAGSHSKWSYVFLLIQFMQVNACCVITCRCGCACGREGVGCLNRRCAGGCERACSSGARAARVNERVTEQRSREE